MIQTKYRFADSQTPVLALAIHGGHILPRALRPYTIIPEADRFREEDPYTERIAEYFSNSITVESSRFAVDLNRRRERAVYLKPEDSWGLPTRSPDFPQNLVDSLLQSYDNWYNALSYQIERLLSLHPFLIVLDLHSYNHRRGGPDAPPDPGLDNPDIILGRSNMPEDFYPLVEDLRLRLDGQVFEGSPLDVRCDVKFPGGNFPRFLHNKYPGKLICIAVEFKKIYMNEWTGRLNPFALGALRSIFLKQVQPWIDETLKKAGSV